MFLDFNAKYVQCLSFDDKLIEKLVFRRSGLNSSVFEKTFNLILMHFIHETLCFEEFLHKIALFFKNLNFPNFRLIELSLDRSNCLSTDRKCDKNLRYNWPSLIGARLIEFNFQSIKANFRPIEIWKLSFIKSFFSRVLHYFKKFFQTFPHFLSLTNPI